MEDLLLNILCITFMNTSEVSAVQGLFYKSLIDLVSIEVSLTQRTRFYCIAASSNHLPIIIVQ